MQGFNPRRALAALVVITFVLIAGVFASRVAPGSGDQSVPSNGLGAIGAGPARLGEPAPDFVLEDLAGSPVRLSDLRGKTVLINFWATWCIPCRREMPDMEDAYQEMKAAGVVILALNQRESRDQAAQFAANYGVTFPVLLDTDAAVSKAYRTAGLPESWLVDTQGTLRDHQIGPYTSTKLRDSLGSWLSTAETKN